MGWGGRWRREEPDAPRGARSGVRPGPVGVAGGPALGVPTRCCALGDCGCPGARESRCVTGADAPARLEAPGLPLTHQKALPRGPGGGKPGGLGGAGGGSGPGRRPARSSEALRAGKPQGGVCGSGDRWGGRGRGERGPLASCRGHLRRGPAAGDRRKEQAPTPPALGGPPPGPPPLPRSGRAARDPGVGGLQEQEVPRHQRWPPTAPRSGGVPTPNPL